VKADIRDRLLRANGGRRWRPLRADFVAEIGDQNSEAADTIF
jgi:hypothetical protein